MRFEEPIAVVWSNQILSCLRKRTSALGQDYVELVGEVVDWARSESARVQPRVVEALHQSLQADTKELGKVGKEAIDDLKKKVRAELYERLQKRVRERCEHFVKQRKDEGPGVKRRILELLHEELAQSITDVAKPVAVKVLTSNYHEVQQEIIAKLDEYKNPLDRARNAIVQSHEDSVRRSDAAQRRRVLAEVSEVLRMSPSLPSGATT